MNCLKQNVHIIAPDEEVEGCIYKGGHDCRSYTGHCDARDGSLELAVEEKPDYRDQRREESI